MSSKNEPVRKLEINYDDNGNPSWSSFPSHKNIKVRGACDLPPHLPGLIILVHGVNSTGEWFQLAEMELCKGLNKRLNLQGTQFELSRNVYDNDGEVVKDEKGNDKIIPKPPLIKRKIDIKNIGNSPIIRFYWGYASPQGEEDSYVIPLANIHGEDYHRMKREGKSPEEIKNKGPYFWGGGPFQNGTNNLYSLWSNQGFNENFAGLPYAKIQALNEDEDRLLTNAPPRKYYSHAAKRLADLLDLIRKKYPKDTVSIISHSQGTMIALAAAALAEQAPDALFIMNSPYAMDNTMLNAFSLPESEGITAEGRESTLSAIVDKVAKRATHLSSLGYEGLCVGQTQDKKNWRPDGTITASAGDQTTVIPERDNHGRTYLYFCPHDRVMGSLPLRSIGWQGLPNSKTGAPHRLLTKHKGQLFQRMLARSVACGGPPNPETPFGRLPDGKPFWDDTGDKYQSSSTTYPDPDKGQTVFINGEQVPEPIQATELADFDETRVGLERGPEEKDGWGEVNPKKGEKNDNTYDNYLELYPDKDVVIGFRPGLRGEYDFVPITRKETLEEKDRRLRTYVSQPTDHSTLPGNSDFMRRVVAYDLPVGYCDATWDKAFLADLRRRADWTQGADPYLDSGKCIPPSLPDIISTESSATIGLEERQKEAQFHGWLPGGRPVNKA